MRVTVITICRNSAKTIRRTMNSLLAQSSLPDEYIVVDGISTDGTLEILREYVPYFAEKNIDYRVMTQRKCQPGEAGIPVAWNQGIQSATGEIIGLLNSDDWYGTEALASLRALCANNPNAEAAVLPIQWTRPDGSMQGCFYPHCMWLIEFLMPIPHPGCFVKRSLYEKIGMYDTRYKLSADYDFIWRCRRAKAVFCYGERPMVFMETGGAANANRAVARRETLEIASRHSRSPLLAWCAYFIRLLTGR